MQQASVIFLYYKYISRKDPIHVHKLDMPESPLVTPLTRQKMTSIGPQLGNTRFLDFLKRAVVDNYHHLLWTQQRLERGSRTRRRMGQFRPLLETGYRKIFLNFITTNRCTKLHLNCLRICLSGFLKRSQRMPTRILYVFERQLSDPK